MDSLESRIEEESSLREDKPHGPDGRCDTRYGGLKMLELVPMDTETGTSLKAAGWKCIGEAGGKRWTGERRPEVDLYPAQMKLRFEKE